jgi:hypothetical protein
MQVNGRRGEDAETPNVSEVDRSYPTAATMTSAQASIRQLFRVQIPRR